MDAEHNGGNLVSVHKAYKLASKVRIVEQCDLIKHLDVQRADEAEYKGKLRDNRQQLNTFSAVWPDDQQQRKVAKRKNQAEEDPEELISCHNPNLEQCQQTPNSQLRSMDEMYGSNKKRLAWTDGRKAAAHKAGDHEALQQRQRLPHVTVATVLGVEEHRRTHQRSASHLLDGRAAGL